MTYTTRKFIFLATIFLFITAAPLVILSAQGYSLTWQNGFHVQKNGLLLVNSHPSGAKIFINNRDVKLTTPARFTTLKPGQYRLSLSLVDYAPWQTDVTIQEERATFSDHVILTPEPLTIWSEVNPALRLLTISHRGSLMALIEDGRPSHLILKTRDGQTSSTLTLPALSPGGTLALDFSADDLSLLLTDRDRSGLLHPWIKTLENDDPWQDLSPFMPRPLKSITWAADYEDALLFWTPTLAAHLFLASHTVVPLIIIPHLSEVTVRKDRLVADRYVLISNEATQTTTLFRRATLTQTLAQIASLPGNTDWSLVEARSPAILAINQKTKQIYYWPEEKIQPQIFVGLGASLDNRGGTLLTWDEKKLLVNYTKEQRPPKLYHFDDSLKQIFWYSNLPVVILLSNHSLEMLTVAPDSLPNQRTIFKTPATILSASWSAESTSLLLLTQQKKERQAVLLQLTRSP